MTATASQRSFSLGSIVQYVVFAVVAYVFAGAPLMSILSGSSHGREGRSRAIVRKGAIDVSKEKLESLVIPAKNLTCEEHAFKGVYVLNREPLVVYIEGFLAEREAEHVTKLSEPLFAPSTVWTSGREHLDPTVRLSEKALVPRDRAVQCIEDRARTFQGWRPYVFIEKLWAQKYGPGGHYTYHYDWSTAIPGAGRISSFMVWLEDDCEGGGTRFPRLERPDDESWCRFIECGEQMSLQEEDGGGKEQGGITFRPVRGNAVFWENMRADGTGYEESWHAGLPVMSGTKIGLNIWSWYQEGYVPEQEEGSVQKEL